MRWAKQVLFGISLLTIWTGSQSLVAQSIQFPAEPVLPTSFNQCQALTQQYYGVRRQMEQQIQSCHESNKHKQEKWGVVGRGYCSSWITASCKSVVAACDAAYDREKAAVNRRVVLCLLTRQINLIQKDMIVDTNVKVARQH